MRSLHLRIVDKPSLDDPNHLNYFVTMLAETLFCIAGGLIDVCISRVVLRVVSAMPSFFGSNSRNRLGQSCQDRNHLGCLLVMENADL